MMLSGGGYNDVISMYSLFNLSLLCVQHLSFFYTVNNMHSVT